MREGLYEVGDPHIDQDIALPDPVADVVPILLDVAGYPRIDRRHLERLDCPRLYHGLPDITPLRVHDCNAGCLPTRAFSRLVTLLGLSASCELREENAQDEERQGCALGDGSSVDRFPRLSGAGKHRLRSPVEVRPDVVSRWPGGGHCPRTLGGWHGQGHTRDELGHSGYSPGRRGRAKGTG